MCAAEMAKKDCVMKRLTTLMLIVLSTLAVSACGLRGTLERPPPMWGDAPEESQENNESDD
jgi:predicted small lipoprotein YifL